MKQDRNQTFIQWALLTRKIGSMDSIRGLIAHFLFVASLSSLRSAVALTPDRTVALGTSFELDGQELLCAPRAYNASGVLSSTQLRLDTPGEYLFGSQIGDSGTNRVWHASATGYLVEHPVILQASFTNESLAPGQSSFHGSSDFRCNVFDAGECEASISSQGLELRPPQGHAGMNCALRVSEQSAASPKPIGAAVNFFLEPLSTEIVNLKVQEGAAAVVGFEVERGWSNTNPPQLAVELGPAVSDGRFSGGESETVRLVSAGAGPYGNSTAKVLHSVPLGTCQPTLHSYGIRVQLLANRQNASFVVTCDGGATELRSPTMPHGLDPTAYGLWSNGSALVFAGARVAADGLQQSSRERLQV